MASAPAPIRLGLIGAGRRLCYFLPNLAALSDRVEIAAIADPAGPQALELLRSIPGVPANQNVRLYESADELLQGSTSLDGLMVGTRCSLHTPIAVRAASSGLPLFLEKPVATGWQQLSDLATAYRDRYDSVVVSFPLRTTPLLTRVLEIVRSGQIGVVNQVQAVNNVPYGGVYFGEWYRDFAESGGLWLQKATHDFDYIALLMGQPIVRVAATSTQRVYGGTRPFDLRCSRCEITATCPESPENLAKHDPHGANGMAVSDPMGDHACAFSDGILNEDAGSALLQFEDGTHASYSQNFLTRKTAGRRGAVITGYLGTLAFDWYSEKITVTEHHGNAVEEIEVKASEGHAGGDSVLAQMFLDLLDGRPSRATLADGIASVASCLAARDSSAANAFRDVPSIPQLLAGHGLVNASAGASR